MDVVSFETAKRLKAAGFPQPEPEFGQMWYDAAGEILIVAAAFKHPLAHYTHTKNKHGYERVIGFSEFSGITFAPHAIDIIVHGGLTMASITWINASDGMDFQCEYNGETYYDASHAEVCASAWLDTNRRQIRLM